MLKVIRKFLRPLKIRVINIRAGVKQKYHSLMFSQLYKYARPINNSYGTMLFWVPGGMSSLLHVEGAIATALRLRGIKVHAVICDGIFKACARRTINETAPLENWSQTCKNCIKESRDVLDIMKIPYSFIGDFVSEAETREFRQIIDTCNLYDFSYNNINVGTHVRSSVIRYLQGESINSIDKVIAKEYAFAGLVVASSALSVMEKISPFGVFMSHGTYVDWGIALHIAVSRGIAVTAWHSSYLDGRLYFRSVEETRNISLHVISPRTWEVYKKNVLTQQENELMDNFINDRYQKNVRKDKIYITFNNYSGDTAYLRKKYQLENDKPLWGIMAHLNWDSVADYSPMAYANFDDWILDTLREIINISSVNWIIKIHPVEAYFSPDSGIEQLIKKHFPLLPAHIKVIPSKEYINSLDFFNLIDGGVTVYGTSGLEMALKGKPVILAGEAHYSGKGFTYDGFTKEAYKELLHKADSLKKLTDDRRTLARKYAYCHFIQRQIPIPVIDSVEYYKFKFNKKHLLLPGKNPFIDFICNRIIDKKEFIMDDKLVNLLQTLE